VKLLPLDRPELLEVVAGWLARKENYQWLDFGNGRQIVTPALLKVMTLQDFKKMTFASLFTDESKPAFVKMKPILQTMGSSVHCLYVNTPNNFIPNAKVEELMKRFQNGEDGLILHKHIYNHAEVEKGILDFSDAKKIGWIGIATNNRKSSAAYNIGVTETLLFKSDTPIFSVKFSSVSALK
jgi:hypothetical protein